MKAESRNESASRDRRDREERIREGAEARRVQRPLGNLGREIGVHERALGCVRKYGHVI